MVTHAAKLFRSIAPIAGYQYDVDKDVVFDGTNGNLLTGLFHHHSRDDPVVRFDGCCEQSVQVQSCCCGISARNDQCISAEMNLMNWGREINKCTGTLVPFHNVESQNTCYTYESCQANTVLCIYENQGHFSRFWFPTMKDEIGHFFARDACSLQGGEWSSKEKKCSCVMAVSSKADGIYCLNIQPEDRSLLALRQSNRHNINNQTEDNGVGHIAVWIQLLSILVCIGFVINVYLKRKEGRPKKNWHRIPTKEQFAEVELITN